MARYDILIKKQSSTNTPGEQDSVQQSYTSPVDQHTSITQSPPPLTTTQQDSRQANQQPAATAPGQPDEASIVRPSDQTYGRPYSRTTVRRGITRYAFEFYQDQIETIRRWSLEEKLQGGNGNMSEMVREALDDYIAKRRGTATLEESERS
jgi:hypothetical protein